MPVGNHDETITVSGTGSALATVAASFTVDAYTSPQPPPTYQSAWEAAKAIIEAADFSILQNEANTQTDLRYRLADIINEMLHNVIPAQAGISFTVSPSDVVIFDYNFRPAIAGDADNPSGTNGYFEFRVTPPDTRSSAYNDGVITATSLNDVANEQLTMNNEQLRAWVQNGMLYVKGLIPGKPWYVYNLYGQLICTGRSAGDVETQCIASLPGRGVYFVVNGQMSVKVNN